VAYGRHPILAKSPLRSVVCQLKFPKILGVSSAQVRPLQERLGALYPEYVPGEVQEFLIGPGVIRQSPEAERLYQFRSTDGAWAVSVSSDSVALESSKFPGYEAFATRWHKVVGDAVEVLGIKYQDRFGLRFINEIDMPPTDALPRMREMINPELIAPVGSHPRLTNLQLSLQELRLKQTDGNCTLRHGYVVKVDGTRVYILDLDYYDEVKRELSVDGNLGALASFNNGLYEIFRWCITDHAYKSFEPNEASVAKRD